MIYQKFVARKNNTLKVKKIEKREALPVSRKTPDITKRFRLSPRTGSKNTSHENKSEVISPAKEYPDGFMFVSEVPSVPGLHKERRCIFTVAVGKEMKWLFSITHPFMREYARKCNADFVIVDDNWRKDSEHPCLLKQAVNSFWYRYDRVLYVDSDILIKPNAPNIFEEVPIGFLGVFDEFNYANASMKERKLEYIRKYVEKHNELYPSVPLKVAEPIPDGFYNMGVFVCSKDTNPHKPIENRTMRLGVSPHYDQTYCNSIIKSDNIPVKSLSRNWNKFRSLIRNKRDFEEAYFVHYVGKETENIKKDIEDYGLLNKSTKRVKDEYTKVSKESVSTVEIAPKPIATVQDGIKRFICTIIVGNKYRELSKYSLPFIQKYADKCNADLIIFDEKYQNGYEHPILMKTEMNTLWDKYDQGCYIDLDMLVKEETPNVFDLVPMGYLGCVERGKSWESKPHLNIKNMMPEYLDAFNEKTGLKYSLKGYNYKYYNAGLFVCTKDSMPYVKEELVLTGYKYEFYEQSLFNLLVHVKGIKTVDLPISFNRSPSENPAMGTKDLLYGCWISHYTIGEERLKEDSKRLVNKDYSIGV